MNSIRRCKPLLGTYVEVAIIAEESRDTLIDMSIAAYEQIQKVQDLMSFHDSDSEISHINRFAHERPWEVSPETEEVLSKALELSRKTDGRFDVSIAPQLIQQDMLPDYGLEVDASANWKDISLSNGKVSLGKKMLLDLGGIAKGYGVDRAISQFDENINVIINAGGDIRMSHWQGETVHIRSPNPEPDQFMETPMRAPAIATSANYYLNGKNGIISPQRKQPVNDRRSISVFASSCMLADALTKVAFLSDDHAEWLNSFGAQVLVIDNL